MLFDEGGEVRRLAVHVSQNGVGRHVVFVVELFLPSGRVDDQLIVLQQSVEDVLGRENALSELVGLEQGLFVERVFLDGRLLLEVLREGVHEIYKKRIIVINLTINSKQILLPLFMGINQSGFL